MEEQKFYVYFHEKNTKSTNCLTMIKARDKKEALKKFEELFGTKKYEVAYIQ